MYELAFHPSVTKDLRRLAPGVQQRVLDKVCWLLDHVEEWRHEPLTAQWAGMYRLRVGDYRVVYGIDREHRQITVYAVGHRSEIYRLREK
jgi:mRNA interferase RelE/StbE